MKKVVLYTLVLLAFVACNEEEDTSSVSDVAQLYKFSLVAQDSFPGIAAASFVIEELRDTGRVEIVDSLPYGTPLRIVPNMSFYATPGSVRFYSPKDTVSFLGSGTDTIDFSSRPMKLLVYASDLEHYKWYEVCLYAHTVNPNLFQWKRVTNSITGVYPCQQKAMYWGGQFLCFCNDGFETKLFTAFTPSLWTGYSVTGLPSDCRVRSIVLHNNTLYYGDSTGVYSSLDGKSWVKSEAGAVEALVMSFNEKLWAIVNHQLAYLQEGKWSAPTGLFAGDTLPSSFPVSDFAVVNYTSNRSNHVLIGGGYNRQGWALNCLWNIECNNGYRAVNYSVNHPEATAYVGAEMVCYDNKIWRIGGLNAKNEYLPLIQSSTDEGLYWSDVDTALRPLQQCGYTSRSRCSAFVQNKNLYIIGGQSKQQTFMDVYCGRINEIDFEIR